MSIQGIKDANAAIAAALVALGTAITAVEEQIADLNAMVASLNTLVAEKDALIAARDAEIAALKAKGLEDAEKIAALTATIAERDATIVLLLARIKELEDQLPPVQNDDPVNLIAPSLPDQPVVGTRLFAVRGQWEKAVSIWNRWFLDGVLIEDGDTGGSTMVKADQVGKKFQFEEEATGVNGVKVKVRSAPSLPVVATLPPPPPPPPPPPSDPTDGVQPVTHWVLPVATGKGDGSSYLDAMAWANVVPAPGRVYGLIADKGNWPGSSKAFNAGGNPDNPCVFVGVKADRTASAVQFVGSRPLLNPNFDPEWARAANAGGQDFFVLGKGADYLVFRWMDLRRGGECFRVNRTIKGLGLDKIEFNNVKEGLWMDNDLEPDGPFVGQKRSIIGGVFKRIRVIGAEMGLRINGDSTVRIEGIEGDLMRCMGNISFFLNIGKGDLGRTDKAKVDIFAKMHGYSGICRNAHDQHFNKPWMWVETKPDGSTVNHLLYAPADSNGYSPITPRTIVQNPAEWQNGFPGTDYWNGDIISAENDTTVHVEDMTALGCPDGGYDMKGHCQLIRCVAQDNKRNFRFHGTTNVDDAPREQMLDGCFSIAPRKRGGSGGPIHVHVQGGNSTGDRGMHLIVRNCTFRGNPPSRAFAIEPAGERKWGIDMRASECVNNVFEDGINGALLPLIP